MPRSHDTYQIMRLLAPDVSEAGQLSAWSVPLCCAVLTCSATCVGTICQSTVQLGIRVFIPLINMMGF